MKATELRIGNTIESSIGGEWYEVAVTTDTIYNFINDFDVFNKFNRPIPLSEDILLRLGFVRINHSWSLNDGSENYHYEINGNERHFLLYFNGRQFSANDGKLSSFRYENNKHLHQLQNLYFALTGTELTLNP
jgi:hypothetical protein